VTPSARPGSSRDDASASRTPDTALAFALFCRVVDNFGDAGVCWRLARQLAGEHASTVDLWIDRPDTLASIEPRIAAAGPGSLDGVRVHHWVGEPDAPDAQVVVSAFGCELPGPLRARLAGGARRPLWVNLEYLSAEPWVDGCHGLVSVRPADGAREHFFYPGFTAATGGLLRERGLLARRDAFVDGGQAPRWLAARGLAPQPGERLLSLFCYPQAPVAALIQALQASPSHWRVLVPAGIAERAVADFLGAPLPVGEACRRGRLSLQRFALLPQDDFDRLLWSCELNFVRGEDSWIRAHWAGRAFVWQPYPQAGATHMVKLEAFLSRVRAAGALPEPAVALMRAWSGDGDLGRHWPAFEQELAATGAAQRRWAAGLAQQPDLAEALMRFCATRLG
jgi:uncharacterized repeat protein (TIGR03837 family)